jgi:hypothetical protein
MNENAVAIVPKGSVFLLGAVIDESGSMDDVIDETIQGYNIFVDDLKTDQKGKIAFVSTFTFDYKSDSDPILKIVQNGALLENAIPLSRENYRPRGYTPLYDAISQTIVAMEDVVERNNVDKVTLLIQTDGAENRSKEFSHSKVKTLIEKKTTEGWQVVFLGADLANAKDIGVGLGVSGNNSMRYSKSATEQTFRSMSVASSGYRSGGSAEVSLSDKDRKDLGDV